MILAYILGIGAFALLFALIKYILVIRRDKGTQEMQDIAQAIHAGSMAFLFKQYQVIIIFVIAVAALLWFFLGWQMATTFVAGALFSAVAGNIGMRVATRANVRTAQACSDSVQKGFSIAFSSGTIMGMTVTGLGLLGVTGLYIWLGNPVIMYGFGFGASAIALFARVGGGIYTKAADVGADLVGKVEKGIPEDDPRNPAVIADNVGDNVGDVAGMSADLFESYVDAIIVTMVLGIGLFSATKGVIAPLAVAGIGIFASLVASFFMRARDTSALGKTLNKGILIATILMAAGSFVLFRYYLDAVNVFWATVVGLVAGVIIGLVTQHYTSDKQKPTREVARAATTGAGTNVIAGLALGMHATVIPLLTVAVSLLLAFYLAGLYGVAIAAVGMLSTLGITLAADTYGPIADNAAGIAEMAGMSKKVRARAEELDAVGNTTAAIGKGFAIGSAALTALALFVGYASAVNLSGIDVLKPVVLAGLFIGGLLPFVFSSMSMKAVGQAAVQMVEEVRRQFKTIKGLMEGKKKPDYKKCVSISTAAAIKQMIVPSLLAMLAPIIVGLLLGPEAVGGLLVGTIVTGFLLAIMMSNAGGAWDNAKKYIEAGNFGGKNSDAHKAAVIGDTVGDPFKDTSGPSLNILLKLMSIVALVFAPLIVQHGSWLLRWLA